MDFVEDGESSGGRGVCDLPCPTGRILEATDSVWKEERRTGISHSPVSFVDRRDDHQWWRS